MIFNDTVIRRESDADAEVAHNNAVDDSSSDENVSPHAQHPIIQFAERKLPDRHSFNSRIKTRLTHVFATLVYRSAAQVMYS